MESHSRALTGRLRKVPWWIFPLLSVVVFQGIRFFYSSFSSEPHQDYSVNYHAGLPELFAFICLIPLGFSVWATWKTGSRLFSQETIQHLITLDSNTFCTEMCEFLLKIGFTVLSQVCREGEQFFLIKVIKHGDMTMIKVIRDKMCGVQHLRELVDLLVTEGVENGLIISTGLFSGPAHRFAKKAQLELLDGVGLMILLGRHSVSTDKPGSESFDFKDIRTEVINRRPRCPVCSVSMSLVCQKKKGRPGQTSWICSRHSSCPGRREYEFYRSTF